MIDLRLGDCLAGMATLEDKSVDHVICDPPYEAEAHTLQRRTKEDVGSGAWAQGADVRRVVEKPLEFAAITDTERKSAAVQIARLARRWVIVFCQAEAVATWRDALAAAGLRYRRAAVWVKPDAQPQLSGDRPGMGYESIVCAHAPGRSRWNAGGKCGVYTFNKTGSRLERNVHPTQKPEDLISALVSDFTDPGELVCDPFAGSGTTAVACKRLGRSFIGWEKDAKFHAAALKRIEAAREQFQLPRFPKAKQQRLLP